MTNGESRQMDDDERDGECEDDVFRARDDGDSNDDDSDDIDDDDEQSQ